MSRTPSDFWTPGWYWERDRHWHQPEVPKRLTPDPLLPTLLVDAWGVFIADAQDNFIGFDENWGRGGPLAQTLNAQRALTQSYER